MLRNNKVLKVLGIFAATGYAIALALRIAPPNWGLSPIIVFGLCPPALLSFTVDPSLASVALVLAPINAALYSLVGLVCWLVYSEVRGA